MTLRGEITLSIPGELQYVWAVGVALKSICLQTGMEPAQAGMVELAVVEAVNNSIIHAYKDKPAGNVEVEISLDEQAISIDISDAGSERKVIAEPRLEYDPTDVNSLPEGKMGWYLIHQVMDRVSYRHSRDRNHLQMFKRIIAG